MKPMVARHTAAPGTARTMFLLLLLLLYASVFMYACAPPKAEPVRPGKIQKAQYDPAVWGRVYPLEYESWLKTKEPRPGGVSKYKKSWAGGKTFRDKLSEYPYMALLYRGWGVGIEYNEPRGHYWMLIDQANIDKTRLKAGGACLTCKTPYMGKLVAENGRNLFKTPYDEAAAKIPRRHRSLGVACIDCHDHKDMGLRVTRWTIRDGLAEIGKPRPGRQQMRSVVCAQCHVTYIVTKDKHMKSTNVIFPWRGSRWGRMPVENIIAQIESDPANLEWTQAVTGFKLGFVRHPEFEFYSTGSVHWRAGVSCADCHMPYVRVGANKISDHNIMSPLAAEMQACRQCHPEPPEQLKAQVIAIQDRTMALMTRAGYATATTAKLFELAHKQQAAGRAVDKFLYDQAKRLYVQAFYRVTYLGAENSIGFHNPTEAGRIAGDAIAFASKSESLLRQALATAGVSVPDVIDLDLARYVNDRGAKKLDFRPDQEFADPTGIESVLLPPKAKGLP